MIILQKDPDLSMASCGYPYYVGGYFDDRNQLLCTPTGIVRDPQFYLNAKNIKAGTSTEVISIDRQAHAVVFKSLLTGVTGSIDYDKLIIATGARPKMPPIPGTDLKGIIGFFDPMMVLNEFFTQRTGHGTGLIRHYVDYDGTDCGLDEIDVCAGVDEVVDFILQHDAIITSSLHGLIAADILGRKSALVSFGDRIDTDGFKYADYFSSAGYTGYKPIQVDNKSLLDIVPELRNVAPPVQSKEYIKQLTAYLNEN